MVTIRNISLCFVGCFSLVVAVCPLRAAPITYDFEDGTLQGWTTVSRDYGNGSDPERYASSVAQAGFTAQGGTRFVIGIPSEARDNAHKPLWIRSPKFKIDQAGSLTLYLAGGAGLGIAGTGTLPTNESQIPLGVDSTISGLMGVALRDTSTGNFVLSAQRSVSDSVWTQVVWDVSAYFNDGKTYTVELFDYHSGNGFSHLAMDTVSIPGTLYGEAPIVTNALTYIIMPTYAYVKGSLVQSNSLATTVKVVWGTQDQTNNFSAWQYSTNLGVKDVGQYTAKLQNLLPNTSYYYRFYGVNSAGESFSASTASFTTPNPFNTAKYNLYSQIKFSGYTNTETLLNFPALVALNTNIVNFSYGLFLSGSNDLRFVEKNGGELNYEIDTWDTNGNSYVWVQIPELNTTGTVVNMYLKNLTATQPAYTVNGATWDGNFCGVWHMRPGSVLDSTSRHVNEVSRSGSYISDGTGVVAASKSFNGTLGMNAIWVSGGTDVTNATCSLWFLVQTNNWWHCFFWGGGEQIMMQDSNNIWTEIRKGGGGWTGVASGGPATNQWYHMLFTRNDESGDMSIYVNGVYVTTSTDTTGIIHPGGNSCFGSRGGGERAMWGMIDEARMEYTVRTPSWIWASYSNQVSPSNFMTFSPVLNVPRSGFVLTLR